MRRRVLVGQFGGAVGTLAALGVEGEQVQRDLMNELGLACPRSRGSRRGTVSPNSCVLAISTSTIGRMAHEIYSLQKTKFAELEEPFSPGKVGSSTMPHKRNPPTCETIVAISKILRSTAPLALEAMMTEHERDKTGLQTEREFISRACCLADAAAKKAVAVVAGLTVKPKNMERNLWIQKGLLMSEPVMMELGAKFGRQRAHEMVYEICMKVFEADTTFKEGLLDNPDIKRNLTPEKIDEMLNPQLYTGLAGLIVDRIVRNARRRQKELSVLAERYLINANNQFFVIAGGKRRSLHLLVVPANAGPIHPDSTFKIVPENILQHSRPAAYGSSQGRR